jgi:hypothetical protein
VVSRRLGISVGAAFVRAIVVEDSRVEWAGSAEWSDRTELIEAIARLAGESGKVVRHACVVLERDALQLRTITPAPPLRLGAAKRYVALEAARLFRKNGDSLVTDARLVSIDKVNRALFAAAACEQVLDAVLSGCDEAGIMVDTIGPASEVVVHAAVDAKAGSELAFPNGGTSELVSIGIGGAWRSRLVQGRPESAAALHPALQALGSDGFHFAAAFGAAVVAPVIQLLPPGTRAARERRARHRALRLGLLALSLWIVALLVYVSRLSIAAGSARRELAVSAAAIDSALTERRELTAARHTLAEFAALEGARSRQLATMAQITQALDDSTFLIALHLGPDDFVRLVGYSVSAAHVLAELNRVGLDSVRMESAVTREQAPGGLERDRFTIVGRSTRP